MGVQVLLTIDPWTGERDSDDFGSFFECCICRKEYVPKEELEEEFRHLDPKG